MKKVIVTGGSGRLGQFVIRELLEHGYEVLSIDRTPPAEKLCPSWLLDLREPGNLHDACRGAFGVVHLGAYQAPGLAPDAELFGNNVQATYNVLKAAAELGIKKIVIGSSTAAFGFIYALRPWLPDYLPLDEKHPARPQDPYGLSKVVGEQIAESFAWTYPDTTIASLRFPGIVFDLSYEIVRQRWNDPKGRAAGFWAYIDARDAAAACRLALEASFTGHETMIVAAPTSSMREPTDELLRRFLPSVKKSNPSLAGNWSGVSSEKAERLLGFKAAHRWERYLSSRE
ncbi:MAG TPA: NAD(P)-dependent oxidoreductase [Candidatus Acidoferrales bacterium]|nr:NAD(P)-dependent oxidoreductase [Candidatus Acidoferrales bacterium]